MIEKVIVLGGGTAGLLTAVTLKRKLPILDVQLVHSQKIGIIGVGEGTTVEFSNHFFKFLEFSPRKFYKEVSPTWKLGIRFLWGEGSNFYYTFGNEIDLKFNELERSAGFYMQNMAEPTGRISACMHANKAFLRQQNGTPDLSMPHAFHIENAKLVQWLESVARSLGIKLLTGDLGSVDQSDGQVKALHLEDGTRLEADLFVDASGFRAELISKVLREPWVDYSKTLFCDRALISGWERDGESIAPYTTAEAMNAGWCWRIEHEHFINRGYVFCSKFISDDDAKAEFLAKNPKVTREPRMVPFRSGRHERSWVGNVVAVGNASGFVEPLEATAIHVLCYQARSLAVVLKESQRQPTPSFIDIHNRANASAWDDVRDFLAVHYAFNAAMETPFWRHCREHVDLGGAKQLVDFFRDNGPSQACRSYLLHPTNSYGLEGFYALLMGQGVACGNAYQPNEKEAKLWQKYLAEVQQAAKRGYTVEECLKLIRDPKWKWVA